MPDSDGSVIQTAFDAATAGDLEPLVSLLAADVEWRGRTRGRLWWRHTPS